MTPDTYVSGNIMMFPDTYHDFTRYLISRFHALRNRVPPRQDAVAAMSLLMPSARETPAMLRYRHERMHVSLGALTEALGEV